MPQRTERLAAALAEAWRSGAAIPLPAAAPASRAEAYAVQDRMAELIGEPVAGWKVGATVKAVQILEGHDGPILGRVLASRLFTSPAALPAAFDGCKLECEVAFRFAADVPPRAQRYGRDEIASTLVFHPAIELTASRYATSSGGRLPGTLDVVADNGNAGVLVIGEGIEIWRDIPFQTMAIEARVDGGEAIDVYEGAYRLDPLDAVIDTASELATRGIGFKAGQYLSTGSLTLPTPLRRGQTLVARFADRTLEVALD